MVQIIEVEKESLAAQLGIRPGDRLLRLNGQPVADFIDYQFHQSAEDLIVEVERQGQTQSYQVEKTYDQDLGLILADIRIRHCANNCTFCFIKQNPAGMRPSIYLHDEDYRYSFLYGNFITLTNITRRQLERIARQRLSPLYISVHATDPDVRKQLFRYRGNDQLLDKLRYLKDQQIELHTQVVLVPGINDGPVLEQTIRDLYRLRPAVKSLAIVPVGLTKHRQGLPEIEPVDPDQANRLISKNRQWERRYRNDRDAPFVYLADEFYLLSGTPIPSAEAYGQYEQLENGVGLTRCFLDGFKEHQGDLPPALKKQTALLLLTGELAAPVLKEQVLPVLNQIANLQADLQPIKNEFYGPSVTVSGLLTAQDILAQVQNAERYDWVLLPPDAVNRHDRLLDDFSPAQLAKALGLSVKLSNFDLVETIRHVC